MHDDHTPSSSRVPWDASHSRAAIGGLFRLARNGSPHVALPPGALTPLVPGEAELAWLGDLGRARHDAAVRRSAIHRYRWMREAAGLGAGFDPLQLDGMDVMATGLLLFDGSQLPRTVRGIPAKASAALAHVDLGDDHVGAMLAAALELDCAAFGVDPGHVF